MLLIKQALTVPKITDMKINVRKQNKMMVIIINKKIRKVEESNPKKTRITERRFLTGLPRDYFF